MIENIVQSVISSVITFITNFLVFDSFVLYFINLNTINNTCYIINTNCIWSNIIFDIINYNISLKISTQTSFPRTFFILLAQKFQKSFLCNKLHSNWIF